MCARTRFGPLVRLARGPVQAVSRSWRKLLLAGLWLTAAAAEWAALRPVIFQEHARPEVVLYHVVGGSFAACGLLAWHRRPDSRAGPLMVVTGLLFFAHGMLGRLHSSLAETIGIAVSNYWVVTFAALLLWFPGGRRRWASSENSSSELSLPPRSPSRSSGCCLPRFLATSRSCGPTRTPRARSTRPISSLGFAASVCLALLLAARWFNATQPVRRASAPAAPGAITLVFLGGLILQAVFTEEQSPYLVWPTLVGLVLVPAVFLAGVWRMWAARAAVGDLLVGLGSTGGRPLQAALAKALGEPNADPGLLASPVRVLHR